MSTTKDAAATGGFHGSPIILIDGKDPFAGVVSPSVCRVDIYQTPDGPAGAPTLDQLREVLTT